jgi:hypothetical protein
MGVYTYGRCKINNQITKRVKYLQDDYKFIDIGQIKYLFKPVGGMCLDDWSYRIQKNQERMDERYARNWENVDMPQFVVVCDKLGYLDLETGKKTDEHEVYDSTKVNSWGSDNTYTYPATSHDMNGWGKLVGKIRKVGNRWKFIEVPTGYTGEPEGTPFK